MSSSFAAKELQLLAERLAAAAINGEAWPNVVGNKSSTVVVGAGGSFPAADFIARVLRYQGTVARSAFPLDAVGPEQRLIAVSYSGSSADVVEAIRIFRRTSKGQVVSVTRSLDCEVASSADIAAVHGVAYDESQPSTAAERGFLSFAATAAPAAAFLAATHSKWEQTKAVADIANITAGDIEVVATGWAWPAALDVESKWIEANLGQVTVHEAKNLSHGRFQSLLSSSRQVLLLTAGTPSKYSTHLMTLLRSRGNLSTVHCSAPGPEGGLALLTSVQALAVHVGDSLGIDVSKPRHIFKEGVALNKWRWN